MSPFIRFYLIGLSLLLISCKAKVITPTTTTSTKSSTVIVSNEKTIPTVINLPEINDTTFVNLKSYSQDFVYDMKYATTNNFLKAKVYECDECYLRLKTVKAMIEANEKLMKRGYKIKIFDCYRPLDIQKKMWKIVSNPEYVADPSKGSIHNRGGAIDITLVDKNGKELDMGTAFDHFGVEASHNYSNLSDEVIANRKLLKKIMLNNNFKSFDSEWWHYNLKNAKLDKVSNFKWKCD